MDHPSRDLSTQAGEQRADKAPFALCDLAHRLLEGSPDFFVVVQEHHLDALWGYPHVSVELVQFSRVDLGLESIRVNRPQGRQNSGFGFLSGTAGLEDRLPVVDSGVDLLPYSASVVSPRRGVGVERTPALFESLDHVEQAGVEVVLGFGHTHSATNEIVVPLGEPLSVFVCAREGNVELLENAFDVLHQSGETTAHAFDLVFDRVHGPLHNHGAPFSLRHRQAVLLDLVLHQDEGVHIVRSERFHHLPTREHIPTLFALFDVHGADDVLHELVHVLGVSDLILKQRNVVEEVHKRCAVHLDFTGYFPWVCLARSDRLQEVVPHGAEISELVLPHKRVDLDCERFQAVKKILRVPDSPFDPVLKRC